MTVLLDSGRSTSMQGDAMSGVLVVGVGRTLPPTGTVRSDLRDS
jgi:hypothetical protein